MLRAVCLLFCLSVSVFAQMKEINIFPEKPSLCDLNSIEILDVKELSFKTMNGLAFSEISALAYDEHRGLFALSDRGYLFRLDLKIEEAKIKSITLEDAMALKTKKGEELTKNKRDAEGLFLTEEGLIVSFERRPKVSLFDFKAQKIKNYEIPEVLKDIKNYQNKNKALESVTKHPVFGIITAPELPLRHENEAVHTVYSMEKRWKFKASGGITSIELMHDGNLLVLERDLHFFKGREIRLTKLDIMTCETEVCKAEVLISLRSTDGWKLDNFEGLTRVKENVYLMISDDNGGFFQSCIAVLFRLKP